MFPRSFTISCQLRGESCLLEGHSRVRWVQEGHSGVLSLRADGHVLKTRVLLEGDHTRGRWRLRMPGTVQLQSLSLVVMIFLPRLILLFGVLLVIGRVVDRRIVFT